MITRATRILFLIFTVLAIFTASRAIIRALPGDPVETLMAESGTAIPVEAIRRDLGLDRPFLPALASDLNSALHGNWGISLLSRQPIGPLLKARFAKTLVLVFVSLVLGIALSLLIGLCAAASPGSFIDRFCSVYGAVTAALPAPWIGPTLLIVFAVWIPLFPVDRSVILPAITLSIPFSGLWSRLIRERVGETLRSGAAPGARARGIAEWKVVLKYGLAPCAGALSAYLGTQIGGLLAGTFVVEVIFSWKGMGSLLIEGILSRDYPVVEAATFVAATCCLLGTWLGDVVQAILDPRIARTGGSG